MHQPGTLGRGGRHDPEDIRNHTEMMLRRVVVAGQVAQAMLRLVLADRGRRTGRVEFGDLREGVVTRLAVQAACRLIDSSRSPEQLPDVYPMAVYDAAACADSGDPDLAGLALADLASLHLRLGYASDCLRLVELATAYEDLPEQTRRVLAVVRAWAGDYEQRTHDINVGHSEEQSR